MRRWHGIAHHLWRVTAKGTLRPLLQVSGLVSILFSHKQLSTQQSFQVKRLNIIGCRQWPNPNDNVCIRINGSSKYCPEWTDKRITVWHTCLIPLFQDDRPRVMTWIRRCKQKTTNLLPKFQLIPILQLQVMHLSCAVALLRRLLC